MVRQLLSPASRRPARAAQRRCPRLRVMELGEWAGRLGPLLWTPDLTGSLVLHQSCKARQLGVLDGAREVLSMVKGLRCSRFPPIIPAAALGKLRAANTPGSPEKWVRPYLAAVSATGASGLVSLDYSSPPPLAGPRRGAGPGPEVLSPGGDLDLGPKIRSERRVASRPPEVRKTHPTNIFPNKGDPEVNPCARIIRL